MWGSTWLRSAAVILLVAFATNASANFEEAQRAFNTGQFKKARNLLEPLAEAGDARAQYAMGAIYQNGLDVERDYARAERWYRASAEQGYPSGQFGLGDLYERGRGVDQDYAEAARWYRMSAEQTDIEERWPGNRGPRDGSAFAQDALGRLYEEGLGVPRDLAEAERWYRLAADYGYAKARDNLTRLMERRAAE